MIKSKKFILIIAFVGLLVLAWLAVATSGPLAQKKQTNLINQAKTLMSDKIFINAIPVLTQAVEINAPSRTEAMTLLLECYQGLDDNNEAEILMNRLVDENLANEEIYLLLATENYNQGRYENAMSLAEKGIGKFNSTELLGFYNSIRYNFERNYSEYNQILPKKNDFSVVESNGKYGALTPSGNVAIPCKFDILSSFSENNTALAFDEGRIVLINSEGQRIAAGATENVQAFVGMSEGVGAVKINDIWKLIGDDLKTGSVEHEHLTEITNNYYAGKINGKWKIYNNEMEPVSPEFDEILVNEYNIAIGNERAFAKKDDKWILVDMTGTQIGTETYEKAYIFYDSYAAVYNNEKWYFIDKDGKTVLTGEFEDAKSFGSGLASVKVKGYWGLVSENGEIIAEPKYNDTLSFVNGRGAVKEGEMWHFAIMKKYTY